MNRVWDLNSAANGFKPLEAMAERKRSSFLGFHLASCVEGGSEYLYDKKFTAVVVGESIEREEEEKGGLIEAKKEKILLMITNI